LKKKPAGPPTTALILAILLLAVPAAAQVWNLKVVTDGSPDISSLEDFIRSATSRWETPEEKCWALFHWIHIDRRQTSPMVVHGLAVTDPIRQLNIYFFFARDRRTFRLFGSCHRR
jgi:hypothetical protein